LILDFCVSCNKAPILKGVQGAIRQEARASSIEAPRGRVRFRRAARRSARASAAIDATLNDRLDDLWAAG
jgi:hypothetical protein